MKTRNEKPTHSKQRICDHANCHNEGLFKAPKDRTLRDYYWFCLEHVQEYNKSWNYYDGYTAEEIEREIRADLVGHRPTWKVNDLHTKKFKDPFNFFEEFAPHTQKEKASPETAMLATVEHLEAIKTLHLTPPITVEGVKKSYKALAKKYHPDKTGGDKEAEELFKQITCAYHLLMQAFKR